MILFDAYTLMFFYCLGWFFNSCDDEHGLRLSDALIRAFFAAIWPITLVIAFILGNKKGGSK